MTRRVMQSGLLMCLLVNVTTINSQILVDNISPTEAVEFLLGDGVVATNVSFTGDPLQLGYFSGADGSQFEAASGVILVCEDANTVEPGNAGTFLSSPISGEPDLLTVANSVPPLIGQFFTVGSVNDVAILEFDFMPTGDSISFNYVFGSDEYLTWVNTGFNDVFAFFLSGPGITGPFDSPAGFPDGSINIAFVPESDPELPITISSVNNILNSQYYIDNPGQIDIQLNGYTTKFTAAAQVICGENYHIKLAIADGSDAILKSIVVLEEGSFASNAVSIDSEVDVVNPPDDLPSNTLLEGCVDGHFNLYPPANLTEPVTVTIMITGTAGNGVDYENLDSEIVFNPGETTEVNVITIADDLTEGTETITLSYIYENSCGEIDTSYASIDILDYVPMVLEFEDITLCPDETTTVSAIPQGGVPGFTYFWDDDEIDSSRTFDDTDDGEYSVTVTDYCEENVTAEFEIVVLPDGFETNSPFEICFGLFLDADGIADGGAEPYTYSFDEDSLSYNSQTGFTALFPGVYEIITTDFCGDAGITQLGVVVCDTRIPNIFTPDGGNDSLNYAFIIEGLEGFPNSALQVFNRWGNLVYESDNYDNLKPWKADEQADGVYYYIFKRSDGNEYEGHVQVIRK